MINMLHLAVLSVNLPTFMPHAKAVLEQVKASGLKMALVTGSAKDEAYPILKGYGILIGLIVWLPKMMLIQTCWRSIPISA